MGEAIAILGAGAVGLGLARSAERAGVDVVFGLRAGSAGAARVREAGLRAALASAREAAGRAGLVFLAVPAAEAVEAARSCGDLRGKVLVDCTNPVRFDPAVAWDPPQEGSVSARLAAHLPGVEVVKAFNTFGAELHGSPDLGGEATDVLLAGDGAQAKARVAELARTLGFDPVDVGPLRNAAHTEALAVLWIQLAFSGRGRRFAFQLRDATAGARRQP